MNPLPPKPTSKIKAVALDMDGLLASSEDIYEQVGTETLKRRGKVFDNDLRDQMMGLPSPKAIQFMIDYHRLDATVEQIAEEGETIFWDLADKMLGPMPGVDELFSMLDEHELARGVVTSGTLSYAERILTKLGVRDRIAFLITAEDVKIGKPNPEPYLMAVERFDVEPTSMVVLEDSGNGCKAGVAAGAYTIAVPSPHTKEHDFDGVRFVADTLLDERIAAVLSGMI